MPLLQVLGGVSCTSVSLLRCLALGISNIHRTRQQRPVEDTGIHAYYISECREILCVNLYGPESVVISRMHCKTICSITQGSVVLG